MEGKLRYPSIDVSKYSTGIIVGRFQVDELHDGHKDLIDTVKANHDSVILFLGVPVIKHGLKNPLDYETRRMMLSELYPELIILPLNDQRKDKHWSNILDTAIKANMIKGGNALLYGSRDSFIPRYHGQFDTCELIATSKVSGTHTRRSIGETPINSVDFRKGVIYANHGRYVNVWPCVDTVVYCPADKAILLARKPNEDKYRFIGGHVDPTDESYEYAAIRELHEEAGTDLEVGGVGEATYIGSADIPDWRHERYHSTIKSTLFLFKRKWGEAVADDDIEEVIWKSIYDLRDYESYSEFIVPEHLVLFEKLIKYMEKNSYFTNK